MQEKIKKIYDFIYLNIGIILGWIILIFVLVIILFYLIEINNKIILANKDEKNFSDKKINIKKNEEKIQVFNENNEEKELEEKYKEILLNKEKEEEIQKKLLTKEEEEIKKELLTKKNKNTIGEINIQNVYNCNDLYENGERKNGIYEIKIKGKDERIEVYCDMETSGGGWTLIFTSNYADWNLSNVYSRNIENPSIKENYSILDKADILKTISGNKIKYRIDAKEFGKNGGVWEVSEKYSFISRSKFNTNILLVEKYGNWRYSNVGIEKRMPYICNSAYGILSTSRSCISKWYGTIAARNRSFYPAPWLYKSVKNPGVIWYWVK